MSTFKIGDAVVIWRRNGDGIYDGNIQYVREVPEPLDNCYGLSDANFGEPRGYVEADVLLSSAAFDEMIDSGEVARLWQGDPEKLERVLNRRVLAEAEPQAGAGEIDYQVEVYPAVDKQGYDIHSRNQGMGWRFDEANAYKWALGIANDNVATLHAEIARLRSELEAARVENDLRGEFLRRVVAIRTELIDDRSNSWLDSIDAIRKYIGGLTRRLQLVDHQISNMIFNLKQNPDTESIVRALEYIAEFAKVDKS